MTIEQARQILKDYAKSLTDQEIQSIIDSFNAIIEVGLRQFEKEYKVEVNMSKSNKVNRNSL